MNWSKLVLLILVIVAVIMILYNLWKNSRINSMKKWNSVRGRVLKFQVEPLDGPSKGSLVEATSITRAANDNYKYRPHITYEYQVGDNIYTSTVISAYDNDKSYTASEIAALASDIRTGQDITIFYNPSNANQSFIQNNESNYNMTWAGIALLVISGILFFVIDKHTNKKHKRDVETIDSTSLGNTNLNNLNPQAQDYEIRNYNSGYNPDTGAYVNTGVNGNNNLQRFKQNIMNLLS